MAQKFTKFAKISAGRYAVIRIEDDEMIGTVFQPKHSTWWNYLGTSTHFRTRSEATDSLYRMIERVREVARAWQRAERAAHAASMTRKPIEEDTVDSTLEPRVFKMNSKTYKLHEVFQATGKPYCGAPTMWLYTVERKDGESADELIERRHANVCTRCFTAANKRAGEERDARIAAREERQKQDVVSDHGDVSVFKEHGFDVGACSSPADEGIAAARRDAAEEKKKQRVRDEQSKRIEERAQQMQGAIEYLQTASGIDEREWSLHEYIEEIEHDVGTLTDPQSIVAFKFWKLGRSSDDVVEAIEHTPKHLRGSI